MVDFPRIVFIVARACLFACAACLIVVAGTSASPAGTPAKGAPLTLEELFTPPWPFGSGAQAVAISDDGRFLAYGWNSEGNPCRDLWVLDRASGARTQLTDFWGETEARRRREFTRQLERDRKQWDKDHPAQDEQRAADQAEPEDDAAQAGAAANAENTTGESEDAGAAETAAEAEPAGGKVKDEPAFDAEKRIEEFEKELEKQRLNFGGIGEIEFRRLSHTLLYTYGGGIWSVDLDGAGAPVQVLNHEQGFGGISRVKDSDDLLLASDCDAFLWRPDGRLRQLTFGGWGEYDNISGMALTADERWLAAVRRDYTATRKQRMPELLGENPSYTEHYHVRPCDSPERVKLLLYDLSAEPPWPIEVELPEEPFFQVENLDWDPTGKPQLLLTTIDKTVQQYRAYLVTPVADAPADEDEYKLELLYEEKDAAWINWDRTGVRWAYGGRLLLRSEHNGLAGIYELVEPEAGATDGSEGEAAEPGAADATAEEAAAEEAATVAPGAAPEIPAEEELKPTRQPLPRYIDDEEIIALSPLEHSPQALVEYYHPDTASKTIGLFDLTSWELTPFTNKPGWRSILALTEDETLLIYSAGGDRNMGELRLLDLDAAKLHEGIPAQWDLGLVCARGDTSRFDDWAATWDVRYIDVPVAQFPEFEHIYRTGDLCQGRTMKVKLYLPEGWKPGKRYPLLIWAHGAGYAQQVKQDPGWYTLFNPWVVSERGWIAAEVDYRGSEGYGRDWRIDVAGRLGSPEVEDLVAAKRYLVNEYGADPERTALWGWSYGGFLTLMALGQAPGEFPVGCAVAPVNRWENYYYWYCTERLGDPAEHKQAYERSAAETYLEYITDDLLIVHGLRDDNTLFQSVAQYIEKCHEKNIDVGLLLFPSDAHGISNEFHYVDVFNGILDYIDAHWPKK